MNETEKEQEKLLKELIEQVQSLNQKIDHIASYIFHGIALRENKKEKLRRQTEHSLTFTYAVGAVAIAVSALLLGFAQTVADSFYIEGKYSSISPYWNGSGCILLSGLLFTICGFIEGKLSEEVGIVKKFSIFGLTHEIIFNWKKDIPTLISFTIGIYGVIQVALALA